MGRGYYVIVWDPESSEDLSGVVVMDMGIVRLDFNDYPARMWLFWNCGLVLRLHR